MHTSLIFLVRYERCPNEVQALHLLLEDTDEIRSVSLRFSIRPLKGKAEAKSTLKASVNPMGAYPPLE